MILLPIANYYSTMCSAPFHVIATNYHTKLSLQYLVLVNVLDYRFCVIILVLIWLGLRYSYSEPEYLNASKVQRYLEQARNQDQYTFH